MTVGVYVGLVLSGEHYVFTIRCPMWQLRAGLVKDLPDLVVSPSHMRFCAKASRQAVVTEVPVEQSHANSRQQNYEDYRACGRCQNNQGSSRPILSQYPCQKIPTPHGSTVMTCWPRPLLPLASFTLTSTMTLLCSAESDASTSGRAMDTDSDLMLGVNVRFGHDAVHS